MKIEDSTPENPFVFLHHFLTQEEKEQKKIRIKNCCLGVEYSTVFENANEMSCFIKSNLKAFVDANEQSKNSVERDYIIRASCHFISKYMPLQTKMIDILGEYLDRVDKQNKESSE